MTKGDYRDIGPGRHDLPPLLSTTVVVNGSWAGPKPKGSEDLWMADDC